MVIDTMLLLFVTSFSRRLHVISPARSSLVPIHSNGASWGLDSSQAFLD